MEDDKTVLKDGNALDPLTERITFLRDHVLHFLDGYHIALRAKETSARLTIIFVVELFKCLRCQVLVRQNRCSVNCRRP